jgi:hypothetical protein
MHQRIVLTLAFFLLSPSAERNLLPSTKRSWKRRGQSNPRQQDLGERRNASDSIAYMNDCIKTTCCTIDVIDDERITLNSGFRVAACFGKDRGYAVSSHGMFIDDSKTGRLGRYSSRSRIWYSEWRPKKYRRHPRSRPVPRKRFQKTALVLVMSSA